MKDSMSKHSHRRAHQATPKVKIAPPAANTSFVTILGEQLYSSAVEMFNAISYLVTPAPATSVSAKGKLFIKSWEQGPGGNGQPALKVYDDANRKYRVNLNDAHLGYWTIGYGHKLITGEQFAQGITLSEADHLFETDLATKAVDKIKKHVTVPLTQQQFDALADYVFNTGSLANTQLLSKLNNHDYNGAVSEMDITTSGGVVMQGLVVRRASEHKIWLYGVYENHH
jgi:lysozyme